MQVQLTWLSPNPENKLINLLNTTNATRGAETDPLPEQLRHPWFVVYREQSIIKFQEKQLLFRTGTAFNLFNMSIRKCLL
jgi:hypothetical protein